MGSVSNNYSDEADRSANWIHETQCPIGGTTRQAEARTGLEPAFSVDCASSGASVGNVSRALGIQSEWEVRLSVQRPLVTAQAALIGN